MAEVEGLRPTPDRVRETVFNWLGQDLEGLTCLDLFAGTGAMGFEAASRGAARVVLVEQDARAYAQLKRNAALIEARNVELVRGDALAYLRNHTGSVEFDVVFLDPPYRQGWLERLEPLLGGVLGPQSLIYVEAEHAVEQLDSRRAVRHGRAGQVHYQLLEPSGS